MARFPSFAGGTSPLIYAITAPVLLLSQPLLVMILYRVSGFGLMPDLKFWVLPLERLAIMTGLTAWLAALVFAFSVAVTWVLALLSFRRARWSGAGYPIAALTVIPGIQIAAVIALALLPRFFTRMMPIGNGASTPRTSSRAWSPASRSSSWPS